MHGDEQKLIEFFIIIIIIIISGFITIQIYIFLFVYLKMVEVRRGASGTFFYIEAAN